MLISLISCSVQEKGIIDDPVFTDARSYDFNKKSIIKCTPNASPQIHELGDPPCWRNTLQVSKNEKLKIYFKYINKESEDLYERGHQELLRYKNGKVVEKMKLRRDDDAYWSEVPFVRIRKQKYLADLDGDGHLEFAIYPFSSGSAIWGTVRIFSLKDKIEYWGQGRLQYEGDTYVQLNCMRCSKFNHKACEKCK